MCMFTKQIADCILFQLYKIRQQHKKVLNVSKTKENDDKNNKNNRLER